MRTFIYNNKKVLMASGIYKIKNLINDKIYIGSAFDLEKRWKWHSSRLKNNSHWNTHLQKAWNKYGSDNFIFEIIEKVDMYDNENKTDFKYRLVDGREQYYLDNLLFANSYLNGTNNIFLELGYNMNPMARGTLGRVTSKETKLKISKSLIGKMVGDKNPNFGNSMSDESRKSISDFRKTTGRKIVCINNNIIYNNAKSASLSVGISIVSIRRILRGEYNSIKGYRFEYLKTSIFI